MSIISKAFSYSVPTAVLVQQEAKDGAQMYIDRNWVFAGLPEPLKGSDWVQTANADKTYSAVDLMDLALNGDGVVYVAHDDRLPQPAWLAQQFKPTEFCIAANGQAVKVFERQVLKSESVTLGSNTENPRLKACNMYLLFVKRQ